MPSRSMPETTSCSSSHVTPTAACATPRASSIRSSPSRERRSPQTMCRRCWDWLDGTCCSIRCQAVVDEDASAAFALAARAVEMGARLASRLPGVVARGARPVGPRGRSFESERSGDCQAKTERSRLVALAGQFSREDLLRAFDLLTRAEADIRGAAQPRYHLEMVLLRWIYLRKLVPIEDLIAGSGGASSVAKSGAPANPPGAKSIAPSSVATTSSSPGRPSGPGAFSASARAVGVEPGARRPAEAHRAPSRASSNETTTFKDAFLAEIRKTKVVF